MEIKDIRVFVCVPAVGKTYLAKMDNRFVDMDSLKAKHKYGYADDISDFEMEQFKGNRGETKNFDTNEFMEKELIRMLETTDKILLFAPNPKMVEMIVRNKIPYCLVFHSKSCIFEIEERMKKRGNKPNFIRSMIDPIDAFYEASVTDSRPAFKIELFEGEFLSDKLLEIFKK